MPYHKRFRMERPLAELPPLLPPPAGHDWLPWGDDLVDSHAEVKHRAFAGGPDAEVFPNLGSLTGCRLLMRAIRDADGFCPQATWLAVGPDGPAGTVQGLVSHTGTGGVQNLGVAPDARGRGLGEALLLLALHGFRRAGVRRAFLEVTANNHAAVRLYRRLGFRSYITVYREIVRPAPAAT